VGLCLFSRNRGSFFIDRNSYGRDEQKAEGSNLGIPAEIKTIN